MLLVVRLLLLAAIGAAVGLGSVWLALTDPRLDFATRIGEWRVVGGPRDPYAAARVARAGTLPLGAAEGVAFVAETDAAGRPLDPRCHYAVSGAMPAVELWTLAVTDRAGHPPRNPADRIGFTGNGVIRRADGTVEIVLGPTARPGNFVPTAGLDSLRLTLRAYSPRLAADLPPPAAMPTVALLACGGGERG